ncbi:CBM96 family carbohydrate-binding protein [Paenibacillus chitinolyticus]
MFTFSDQKVNEVPGKQARSFLRYGKTKPNLEWRESDGHKKKASNEIGREEKPVPATPPAGVKAPIADAYVLDGSGAGVNYGTTPTLYVKDGTAAGYTRKAYLKFDVSGLTAVNSAKLRLFGGNTQDASNVQVKVSGAAADGWTETGLTWNNAPAAVTGALSTIQVGSTLTYYELDVTSFVNDQLSDGIVTLIVEGVSDQDRTIQFNSRENPANKPELVVN